MKRINLVRWILTLCIISITIMLIIQIDGMTRRYKSVSMRLSSEVMRETLYNNLEREMQNDDTKIEGITAYSQDRIVLEGKSLGRKVDIDSYCIYGNVEDVLPVSLVTGNLLIRDDIYGCVLTKKSAFQLFGSIDVVGNEVKINDKTYTIRGIIDTNVEAVVYESASDQDAFSCLEFTIRDENGEFYANQFGQIYGLQVEYLVGGNYLTKVMKNLRLFPFFLVILYTMGWICIKVKKLSGNRGVRYIFIAIGIVLVFIVCKSFGYYPERWIPSKWSNFDHYSDITKDIKSQLHTLSFAKPIAKEVALKSDMVKAISLFIASMIGQIYLIEGIKSWGNRIIGKFDEYTILRKQKKEEIRLKRQKEEEARLEQEKEEEARSEQEKEEEVQPEQQKVEENEEIDN